MKLFTDSPRRGLTAVLVEVVPQLVVFIVVTAVLAQKTPVADLYPMIPPVGGFGAVGVWVLLLNKIQTDDMYGSFASVAGRPMRYLWRAAIILPTSATAFVGLYLALGRWVEPWLNRQADITGSAIADGLVWLTLFVLKAAMVIAFISDVVMLVRRWLRRHRQVTETAVQSAAPAA